MSTNTHSATRVERYHTIVIGGSQAGLAAGQQLAERNIDFCILDGGARVGDTWRRRWDSLRLFTPAKYSGLPGWPFPAPPTHLPDKDEVADYLERYAEKFDLPIRLDARVEYLTHDGKHFAVLVKGTRYEAENVVVATGPFQDPFIPALSGKLSPTILQLHSSEYRSPFDLPDGPVLVVGAGPSGAQIALELARFRKVWLAGPETGYLPRRALGRDLFDWIWPIMSLATVETRIGQWLRRRVARGGDSLIGLSKRMLAGACVLRLGRVVEARGGLPVCATAAGVTPGDPGEALHPRVIIWCTGFTTNHRWIDLPVFDAHGGVRHTRGVASGVDGLYFLGLRFQHRMTSTLLGGVGNDATFVAEHIARRVEQSERAEGLTALAWALPDMWTRDAPGR